MSVQRFIDTGFWDDEWIVTLPALEKLLFLYLLTNPLTNIAGVYKITFRRISFDTGLAEDEIAAMLCQFSADGKAYYKEGYIILPNWPKHQRLGERSRLRSGLDNVLNRLSLSMLDYLGLVGYAYETPKIHKKPIDANRRSTTFDDVRTRSKTSSYSDSDSDTDTDTDRTQNVYDRGGIVDNLGIDENDSRWRQVLVSIEGIKVGLEEGGESW